MGNGYSRMCVEIGGAVYCWGINDNGQLGDGSKVERHTAVQVVNITTATSVSARHGDHACATLADGTVQCWGSNGDGQLADGTTIYRLTPVLVSGITTATSVSAGYDFNCATLAGDTVQCWGYNDKGQLGNNATAISNIPVQVLGITTTTSVSAGGSSGGGGVPGTIVPLRSADTLSDVEIAGIAVGCIVFVIILTLIGLCVRSRRRADDKLRARLGIPTRGAPVAVTPQQPQVIVIQT